MTLRTVEAARLWVEEGGAGEPTLLLLHGLGATGAVWRGLVEVLRGRWPGRWVVPDLRGHGRSSHTAPYTFGHHAADVAALLGAAGPLTVLSHSMGAAVGLALASGWFGITVSTTVALGIKVSWTEAELERVQVVARRPVRWFDDRAEAVALYLRVAGLDGLVAPDSPEAASGVVEQDGRYRLAADNATVAVGAPDPARLLAAAQGRVVLACGEHDALVRVDELRRYDPTAIELAGLGHNAHVQAPERVWELLAASLQ